MLSIQIIGAGQLGSRHLQSLQDLIDPVNITVVDPSENSLSKAKVRFNAAQTKVKHTIKFCTSDSSSRHVNIAIIATNSNTRRDAIAHLLKNSTVDYLILEKILFDKIADYPIIDDILDKCDTVAWVNCVRRIMPIYKEIHLNMTGHPIHYRVSGSQFGLVTSSIHFIDHLAHLTKCLDFSIDTSRLDSTPILSKRSGFLELTGTLIANFKDGSSCEIICYAGSDAPILIEISSCNERYLVMESEHKLFHSDKQNNWQWAEQVAQIPYQSQITASVIEQLIDSQTCDLTPYQESSKIHLSLLSPLIEFLKNRDAPINSLSFT